MDPLTHGVASFALQRAFFPRASRRSVLLIIAAGLIADLDGLSVAFGPAAYLHCHRAALHSLAFVLLLSLAAFAFSRAVASAGPEVLWRGFSWLAVAAAALLHLSLDVLQPDSVALLWPFSPRRFALDVLPGLDPWLLVIFVLAVLLPELLRLIGEEIGSRSKRPRGRNGAIAGFIVALFYIGLRVLLHGNAVASLQAHNIAGEMPRRVASFPDSTSPFLWHSIVETQSALHLVALRSAGGEVTYASGVSTLHKPEPSPMLAAAQNSSAAVTFLRFARFPKATIEKETEGFSVEIQDLSYQATSASHAIFADINLDKDFHVVSSELQWQKEAAALQ